MKGTESEGLNICGFQYEIRGLSGYLATCSVLPQHTLPVRCFEYGCDWLSTSCLPFKHALTLEVKVRGHRCSGSQCWTFLQAASPGAVFPKSGLVSRMM